jgi:C_GCAxxG_C_C family probable redox protein
MRYQSFVNEKVHNLYWNHDMNCSTTTLLTLSEIYHINLSSQVLDAVTGMPGVGRSGSLCGLVGGSIMFIGIRGKENGLEHEEIVIKCNNFVKGFEKEFGSLSCKDLRPQGFKPENPPHLCEEITKKAIMFTLNFLDT